MLGKMMIHGLVAAILIGGAAVVYAQARADGPAAPPAASTGNGYLQPGSDGTRVDGPRVDDTRFDRDHTDRNGRKHADRLARHDERRNGQDKRHGHDD
jgi:hypothetical protein